MEKMYGWQGSILRINLTTGETQTMPTAELAERFVGGRGFLSKIYWDDVDPKTDARHPDSPLIMMTGPLAGINAIACSRWVIGGKSPLSYPDQFCLGSVGGSLGVKIKAAGFDGIIITGKAPQPSYLHICNGTATIKGAEGLWGLPTDTTLARLKVIHGKNSQSVCIGPAGEIGVRFAVVVSNNSATGGNGYGAVMGSKNLKAVVAEGSGKAPVARPEKLKEVNNRIRSLIKGRLLFDPSYNWTDLVRRTPCPACPAGCPRGLYRHSSGREEVRKNCQSFYLYYPWDRKYHDNAPASADAFKTTSICNEQGLCTTEVGNLLKLFEKCSEKGIVTDGQSGLQPAQLGTLDFFYDFIGKIMARKGFGEILAEGTVRAAKTIGREAEKIIESMVTQNGMYAHAYNARCFITNALHYAVDATPTMNQLHELSYPFMKWTMWMQTNGNMSSVDMDVMRKVAKKFWKSEKVIDFSSYDDKAQAAYIIQNREYAKENLIACDFFYPLTIAEGAEDLVGDPALESRLLSAVTGIDTSEEDYYLTGERVFNLQRAIQCKEGRIGRKDDTINEFNFTEGFTNDVSFFGFFNPEFIFPGPGGELISRKGAMLERDQFDKMMDEYYGFRGWDVTTGLQKTATLEALSLGEIVTELKQKGQLVE
ncbi:MAG: aldehyde ferredoxin oxidoreductase N-terminal domain-containing protein [Candidatus Latescibacteria bacterium]|nr:aldehyde ferredoxin oxidoreductase N-terminal domain-containing protein [Candidatus Latescibacterota bacterium]